MALSSAQVYTLNMLTYAGFNASSEAAVGAGTAQALMERAADTGMTVGEYVEALQDAYGGQPSVYDATFQQILSDPTLSSMTIANYDRMSGSNANMIVFTSDSTSEAVVAYEGSQSGADWRDNFDAVGKTDHADGVSSDFQQKALDYVNSPDVQQILSRYDTVTATGHSKGGNNANYVNIRSDSIDRSITFDAPGFSDEFMKAYHDEIARSQDSIDNYSAHNDYVNILQNAVGTQHYIQQNLPDDFNDCVDSSGLGDFLAAHDPASIQSFFYEGGRESKQDSTMQMVDEFLNSYLRYADADDKEAVTTFLGDLCSHLFYGDTDRGLVDVLVSGCKSLGAIVDFIHFAKEYLNGKLWDALEKMWPRLTGILKKVLSNPLVQLKYPFTSFFAPTKLDIPDVSDIHIESVRVADRIVMNTDTLEAIAAKLKNLCSALDSCRAAVLSAADCCGDIGFVMTLTLAFRFALTSGGKLMGTPERLLQGTAGNIRECSAEVQALCSRMTQLISLVESSERSIAAAAHALPECADAPFLN